MITEDNIKSCLDNLAERYPNIVHRRLEKGTRLKKAWGFVCEIDDPYIDKRLGDFPDRVVPYGPIHRYFRTPEDAFWTPETENGVYRFSDVFEQRVGQCLEKSVLVQLSAQRYTDSYLINGFLYDTEGVPIGDSNGSHAWNVVFENGKPFLIDAENPVSIGDDGTIQPYISPVIGIEEKRKAFVVPQEWVHGRSYELD